jgi:hypothetical protein
LKLEKSLKSHLARQKGKRLRETREREGKTEGKLEKKREVGSQKGS